MTHRAGSADLPLHGGRVPEWLAGRMARLGASEELAAIKRLDNRARLVETKATGPTFHDKELPMPRWTKARA